MRTVLFALLCMSCDLGIGSDPNPPTAPCLAGHVRASGKACTAPGAAIAVDGKTSDWSGLDSIPVTQSCVTAPCQGQLVDSMQVAQFTASGWTMLAIHVHVAGGNPTNRNDTRRLELHFAALPAEAPAAEDVFYAGQSGIGWIRAGRDQTPPVGTRPVFDFAWTADGYELAVPTDYLPFDGAMTVTAAGAAFDGTNWNPITSQPVAARMCWFDGPAGKDDPCAQ